MLQLVIDGSRLIAVEKSRDRLSLGGIAKGSLELGTHLIVLVGRGSSLLARKQLMHSPSGNLEDIGGACLHCVTFAAL